jgi:Flp pilus assembly CpaE family ATPase
MTIARHAMNTTTELMRLLMEWHRLTEREGLAILSDDWKDVARQQEMKQRLRQEMTQVLGPARDGQETCEQPTGEDQRRIDSVVSELIALETRNRDLLYAKGQGQQAELARFKETKRNLHGLRRACEPNRSPQSHSCS